MQVAQVVGRGTGTVARAVAGPQGQAPLQTPGVPQAQVAPEQPMVRLERLRKVFARRDERPIVALDDVSLTVRRGEIFGIIGLSGAGKSTLVRCINLLERPDSGRVWVDGVDLTALAPSALRMARRRIGMVFQHFNLLSSRTAFGNVAFPLEIAGEPPHRIRPRVMELLELVGLADRAAAHPSQLSGGQRQRVGIARALAPEPRVLLCDEPTSALDAETTASILELLRDINRKLGITIVLITHELPVVQSVCERVAVMADGRVQEVGATVEVLTRPSTPAGRRLVGAALERALAVARTESDGGAQLPAGAPGARLLRLAFVGRSAEEPVISRLVRRFDVTVNILQGSIDRVGGIPFGVLLVAVEGEDAAVGAAIDWVREQGVEVVEWGA